MLRGCLGFIGSCVHACRGCSNRRGGGFFHHIGRHLFIEKYPTKPQEITIQLCRKAGEVRVFRLRYLKVSSPLKKRKNPEMCIELESVRATCSSSDYQERMQSLCWALRVWLVFISLTARERLVWNFPNFLSHSNFPPIRARDTRPEGGRLVVGALPLVVWPLELAANGARPGFRAQPGKLPSVFNHRSVYILTVEPLTGQRNFFIYRTTHDHREQLYSRWNCIN